MTTGLAFELKKGTPKYDRIRNALQGRFKMSQRDMSKMHTRWRDAEKTHQLYVPLNDSEAEKERKTKDEGEQHYNTLVVPFSYAMVMAAHTYVSTVFLGRSPIFQYQGRHGESEAQTQAVEAVVGYQNQVGGHLVPLYIWLLDPLKYSTGILGAYWEEEVIHKSYYEETQPSVAGIPIGPKKRVKKTDKIRGYEGAKLFNVRPWDYFPDTRVPLGKVQEGEFVGRLTEVGWNTLVRRQAQGIYFNISEVADKGRKTPASGSSDGREKGFEVGKGIELPDTGNVIEGGIADRGFFTLLEMTVDLVPSEWELGEQSYPEKWIFTLVNPDTEAVIIGAQPLNEAHGRFPFFIQEYEIEGYNLSNRSMYDVLDPLQRAMSWLVNTHFFNTRKVLNDMLLFDPSRVVAKDLLTPGPGRMVRAKPAAYGQDLRTAVHQLRVSDVTNQHLSDTRLIADYMQRASGVTDNIMGLLTPGRHTATAVRQANTLGINRLKTSSEWWSAMGWTPLGQVLVQMTQQHMTKERAFRIMGDQAAQGGGKFMTVRPDDIAGFYDFVPVDGNMPIDRFAQVSLWTQLLGQMRQYPQLAQQYDLSGIFAWVSSLAGLKNINKFRVQVRPDAQVAGQAQAGNVVALRPGSPDASQAIAAGAGRGVGTGPMG